MYIDLLVFVVLLGVCFFGYFCWNKLQVVRVQSRCLRLELEVYLTY